MNKAATGISRRTVIKAMGAAPLMASATARANAHKTSDVIVIGAGLSGLNAALLLEQAGLSVTVLEGRNRIGGRVMSLRDIPGAPEVGGTAFGPGYARLVDAAKRYGVGLVDLTPIIPYFFDRQIALRGELISKEQWPTHKLNPFPDQFRELPPYAYFDVVMGAINPLKQTDAWLKPENSGLDISLHDWLRKMGQSEETINLAYNTNPTHGMTAHDVSALMVMFASTFGSVQRGLGANDKAMGYTAVNGNQSIPEAMANALKEGVHLQTAVHGVRSNSDGVEVRTADGKIYKGKRVISSMPCSVLRRVRLDPILTGKQALGVNTLDSQIISQIHMIAKTPFWEKDGMSPNLFSDGLAGMVIAERKAPDPKDVSSLTIWLRGERAKWADQVNEKGAIKKIIENLESVRPAAKGQLEVAGYKSWYRDPFSSGDWSIYEPGQVSAFAKDLATPHERVHFCGEHTAISNRGMEGAMESGERVALEVLGVI